MVSSYEISGIVYRQLNVTSVNNVISGEVYNGPEPVNDQKENVTINVLANPGEYLQEGVLNVNLHAVSLKGKLPNSKRLKAILDVVMPLVDDVVIGSPKSLHLTVANEVGPFPDKDNLGKHFHNIRLNFVTL